MEGETGAGGAEGAAPRSAGERALAAQVGALQGQVDALWAAVAALQAGHTGAASPQTPIRAAGPPRPPASAAPRS